MYSYGRKNLQTSTRAAPLSNDWEFAPTRQPAPPLTHQTLQDLRPSNDSQARKNYHHSRVIFNDSQTSDKKIDHSSPNRSVPDAFRALNHHESSLVWLPASARWRNLRKICTSQMFTVQRLEATQSIRLKKVQELLNHVEERCNSGEAVDIGRAAFTTTLNLMSNTFFSVDLAYYNSSLSQEFKDLAWGMLELAARPNIADYFPVLRILDPQGVRRQMTVYIKKLFQIFDEIINQRSQSGGCEKNDLLDALLNLTKPQNDYEFSCRDIKHLLLDLFLGGTETTSSALEWAMAELLKNPKSLAKARIELQQVVGKDRAVEESDISGLPYLQAIVKETFRLHPPAPFIPYKAEIDMDISGYIVLKDAQILVNAWAIGRDSSTWPDPNSFVPDRFFEFNIDFKGHDFELIPFGAGRRICPAMPLAYRMVHLMLASLVQSFEWRLANGMKPHDMAMSDKFGLTLQKAEPLRAIPIKL